MELSRQEYGSGLPFPIPGDLPHPGIEPACLMSPALAGGFFTTSTPYCCVKNQPKTRCLNKDSSCSLVMSELHGSSGLGSTYLCIFNETCIKKAALLALAGLFHVFVSWQAIDDVGKSQLG